MASATFAGRRRTRLEPHPQPAANMSILGRLLPVILLCVSTLAESQGPCNSSPECVTWSDLSNFNNIPHKVPGTCCGKRVKEDNHCSLDKDSWDSTTRLCSSFCPETVEYVWGREVPYFEAVTCLRGRQCPLIPNTSAFFSGPSDLPPGADSFKAIEYSVSILHSEGQKPTRTND